jgi:hypothetical protein
MAALTEREEWSRQMRLKFSEKEVLNDDGSINQEYILSLF